jgi:hypothetical protein
MAGATWRRSSTVARWALGQLCLAGLAAVGCGALVWLSLEAAPLGFDPAPIGTEDRRRLVRWFSEKDPRDLQPGTTEQITLKERDINQLFSWGLGLGSLERKARVQIQPDQVTLELSCELPAMASAGKYFNLTATGRAFGSQGELGFLPTGVRVGQLAVPAWLLAISGPILVDESWQIEPARPVLGALHGIELASGEVTVTYGHLQLTQGIVRDALVGLGRLEDMTASTTAHAHRLIAWAESSPATPSFSDCLKVAFEEARRRSINGDPVHENRAAILALAYLIGHPAVEKLIGPGLPVPSPVAAARLQSITLRGRADLRRHYTVSAALEVLSNALTSDSIGLLKEELDADGGSGFSFVDLLADRAGTRLGKMATASDAAARTMQSRLARGLVIDDILPHLTSLPEDLSDAALRKNYGGVDGEEYLRLVADIDLRIADCAAYVPIEQ